MPLAFSLVRLLAPEGAPARAVLSDAQGRFRFAEVPAGEYRLQIERIGYQQVLSPVLRVRAGEVLFHELRSGFEAIQVEGLVARAGGSCLNGEQLSEDPELEALWKETQKGIEIRRAFELQYRFARELRQNVHAKLRLLKDRREISADTLLSEPDSALVREQRRQARRRTEGYGKKGSLALALPDERDLFEESFLDRYCLQTAIEETGGALGLQFRPIGSRLDRIEIRGTVWTDADNYLIRRLEIDWIEGDHRIAHGTVDYSDVPVEGSAFRLPVRGHVAGRPSGPMAAVLTGATADLTISYWNMERVRTP